MAVSYRPKAKELPGTEKHPQGRLFSPTGDYRGDPWKLSPENWMGNTETPAHSDIRTWHASQSSAMPRYDNPQGVDSDTYSGSDWDNPEYDDEGNYNEDYRDYTLDEKERPIAEYGSAIGMHFGSIRAAADRAKSEGRDYLHPVRLPPETLAAPPPGNFRTERPVNSVMGPYRARDHSEDASESRWSDEAANYASRATDLVESGKALAYRNDVEDRGGTSYRALPETVRTWSEDVLNAKNPGTNRPAGAGGPDVQWDDPHAFRNVPHPMLLHMAQQGFNPVALAAHSRVGPDPNLQGSFNLAHPSPDNEDRNALTEQRYEHQVTSGEKFRAGRTWHMRKGIEEAEGY